eukprot:453109_1
MNTRIFTSHNNCDANNNNNVIVKCDAVNRLVNAVKYYSTLNIINNTDDCNIFIELCNGIYHNFLNDYIHFMNCHPNQIEGVYKTIANSDNFIDCSMSKCDSIGRHYRISGTDNDTNGSDQIFLFYRTVFDSLHHFLYHLFHIGLRLERDHQPKYNEHDDSNCIDHTFAAKVKAIKNIKNNRSRRTDRTNNKYNIQTDIYHDRNGQTFTDWVLCQISNKWNKENRNAIEMFLTNEEYDSDALQEDIDDIELNSNVVRHIDNETLS